LASPDDVDDVVQQTFIALYMNLDQINPPEKLRPFLFRVARNLCYDNLRRVYRRDDVSINDCEYRLSSNHISPEENAYWRLMLAGVRQAIDCLPEIHRDTLILYVEEGLSQAEIAEVMHTELGTVKSRLYYARKLLRQLVSPDTLLAIENTK
ncbi:MAG: RNA polymerase sigma factor, partial [Chloroflexota bacterium]